MEWDHVTSSKSKAKTVPTASRIMGIAFWDTQGYIFIDFLLKGETINMACYGQILKRLWYALHEMCLMVNTIIV
jgi:hypothetical protein